MADKKAIKYSKELKEISAKEDQKIKDFYIGTLLALYKDFSDTLLEPLYKDEDLFVCNICKLVKNDIICNDCYNLYAEDAKILTNEYKLKIFLIFNIFTDCDDICRQIIQLFRTIDINYIRFKN